MLIGILSFQGDYFLHKKTLDNINIKSIYVNDNITLNKTDALIIPGGESTVISKFLQDSKLDKEIKRYSLNKSIFGTCAGAIIMSNECDDDSINTLKIMNIKTYRNSWGRQIDSFEKEIKLNFNTNNFYASFIRAPRIKILSSDIEPLSYIGKNPVLVRNKNHLVASFHPEISINSLIHEYFINMIYE